MSDDWGQTIQADGYVARIVGTHSKYRLDRTFQEPDPRGLIVVSDGLYEAVLRGLRRYVIVWGGGAGQTTIPQARAERMAEMMTTLMDGTHGSTYEAARKATRPAKN
jgi:hypothetical protein